MIRTLKAPRNPDLLGRVIAALRLHTEQRRPRNAGDRALATALKKAKVAPKAARRLVGNLEERPRRVRDRLLGEVAKPGYAPAPRPEPRPMPTLRTEIPVSAMVGGTAVHGALNEIFSTDPGVDRLPLYTVRYQGVFCQEETSWDRGSSSDEIYIITSVVHIDAAGENITRTERHPQGQGAASYYGDLDDLDERYGPVAAAWQGYSEHPVSVTSVLFEHDEGDPDAYRDEVDAIVKVTIAVLSKLYPPAAVLALAHDTITDAVNWLLGTGDDVISTETVVLPLSTLELYSSLQWSFYIGERRIPVIVNGQTRGFQVAPYSTSLPYHFFTLHQGSGARYVVVFDVERDPPNERPVVLL